MAWYLWLLVIGVVVIVLYYVVKKMYGAELTFLKWLSNPLEAL